MIEAGVLECPVCGANAKQGALRCTHCAADLQTLHCPSCYSLNFAQSACCARCGNELADFRTATEAPTKHACPRCEKPLWSIQHADVVLEECRACGGYWIDDRAFQKVQARRDATSAWGGMGAPGATNAPKVETVRYVKCPTCQKLMNRVNFARVSGVIIDVCKGHGTWFDRDELRQILEFIAQGGLDKARAKDVERLKEAQREREVQRRTAEMTRPPPGSHDDAGIGGATVVSVIVDLLISLV